MSVNDIKDQIRGSLDQFKSSVAMASKLDAFRVVYEKVDRILSGRPVFIQMAVGSTGNAMLDNAPGWTDGSTIFLNSSMISRDLGKLDMNIIVLHTKAVNFHELAHVMFSPRERDDIVKWVLRQQSEDVTNLRTLWWYAFNGLEDQRIETLFTAKFRPAGRYFEAIVLKWMVNNTGFVAESWPLLYGRKFLPVSIRVPARAAFVSKYGEQLAVEFEAVIDSFNNLTFPADTLRAQVAIRQYVMLLNRMRAMAPFTNHPTPNLPTADNGGASGPQSSYDPTVIRKGNSKARDQQAAKAKADQVKPRENVATSEKVEGNEDGNDSNVDEVFIPGDEGADEGTGDSSPGQGKSLSGEGIPTGSSSSQDKSGKGQQAAGSDSSGQPGEGSSAVGDDSTPSDIAIDAVYDALDELFADQEFQQELNDTANNIRQLMQGDDGGAAWGTNADWKPHRVSEEAVKSARKMTNTLRRLKTELEETKMLRQTAGKIDVRRFMTKKPWETDYFTTQQMGIEEETDLEAVIVIDVSGSMNRFMQITSESLWTVKRSLEALNSRVSVLGFSNGSYVMYQPHEKVDGTTMRLFGSKSSTVPDACLKEALRLFTVSTKPQKLLVAITDGYWQGDEKIQAATISAMHDLDVVTCIIGIGGWAGEDTHGMKLHRAINTITDMPPVAVEIVAEAMKQLAQDTDINV